tara:strand:- start:172 stop:468 length:297 start_codon:yes stop_codon:yes gene_type:complete
MSKIWWTSKLRKTLRKRREELGITQVDLAKKLKWSQAHIQRHENGKADSIDIKVLRRWCGILDLVATYIPAEIDIITSEEYHENSMMATATDLPAEIQ